MTDDRATLALLSTPVGFAMEVLGIDLYPWQADVLTWFERSLRRQVLASLCTPNGAGKDAVVIATLALWWVATHARGRVVITSKDARQIDEQTAPALERHRGKFPDWKFIERYIETPTGGKIILFTTDDPGRAEGFHRGTKPDGTPDPDEPLLIIANEAKSIGEDIFDAIDRCTFNALLLASSPGFMVGRFYDSQFKPSLGYQVKRIGLKDCPHIPPEKIARIVAQHGRASAFARSTLDGEFMEAAGEARFDADGLKYLAEQCDAEDAAPVSERAIRGDLIEQPGRSLQWAPHEKGFVWQAEPPIPGCSYIGFCDPMTGEQSEGALVRDTHGAGILRLSYVDSAGVEWDDEVVATLHHDGGCRWDNDVLADRLSMLLVHYGDAPIIVEANNSGTEVMRLLILAGRTLWRREKPNHRLPGKKMIDVVGFQTNAATKSQWVGALGRHIRERLLVCRYRMATSQFSTFVLDEQGRGGAQSGCHDDWVTGIGMALFARSSAKRMPVPVPLNLHALPGQFGRAKASAWS